jgi:hypothetical protein
MAMDRTLVIPTLVFVTWFASFVTLLLRFG